MTNIVIPPKAGKVTVTSTALFGREYNLKIINKRTNLAIEITDLRVQFDIEKDDIGNPNKGTIKVYNLSERTRGLFNVPPEIKNNETKRGLYVEFSAGYRQLINVVLTGDASSQSQFIEPDWVTTFDVVDGGTASRISTFHRAYKDGFPMDTVIKDVLASFQLAFGYITPNLTNGARVKFGLTLNGTNKKIMDQFSRDYGWKWSIQNNAIHVWDAKGKAGAAVNLSPSSGLLGSPIKTDKNLKFTSLLIPMIVPGCTVVIDGAREFNGSVVVSKQKISGDSHGNAWQMENETEFKP